MQQLVYRRKIGAVGVATIAVVSVSMLPYCVWRSVRLGYLWLRHRHDGTVDNWLTFEDLYCGRYGADPEIDQILDKEIAPSAHAGRDVVARIFSIGAIQTKVLAVKTPALRFRCDPAKVHHSVDVHGDLILDHGPGLEGIRIVDGAS